MKRPVTEQDLINDPSLVSIGVNIGDEYEFGDAPAEETKVAKFDPFTGLPLQPADQVVEESNNADSQAEAADAEQAVIEPEAKPTQESEPEAEPAVDESNSDAAAETASEQTEASESETAPAKEPITYAEILERRLSLNKIEAANLHPGISNIAQWGDLVARQEFKPAE